MDDSNEPQSGAALRAALGRRGFAYSRIVGTSMLPTLSSGDIVLIRPCERPRLGDVVTFVLDGRLVTHRLIQADAAARNDAILDMSLSYRYVIARISTGCNPPADDDSVPDDDTATDDDTAADDDTLTDDDGDDDD